PRLLVGGLKAVMADAGIGEPTIGEPVTSALGVVAGDTCHIDVADRWGNMVSATPSGGWLQSSPVIPEIGVCLGSRMQMFWLEEDRKSTRLNSSHVAISYAVFCLKKKKKYEVWTAHPRTPSCKHTTPS